MGTQLLDFLGGGTREVNSWGGGIIGEIFDPFNMFPDTNYDAPPMPAVPQGPSVADMFGHIMPMFQSLLATMNVEPPPMPERPSFTELMFMSQEIPYTVGGWEQRRQDILDGVTNEMLIDQSKKFGLDDTLLTSPLSEGSRPGNIEE